MQYTPNYNLMLPEGTDLVNYLTQTNPNFSSLDTTIKGVSDLTITPATEVTSGTAHAISRTLPNANVIRFTATSNWLTGDTMTVDGTPVTVLKTDGTSLKTGDYIIGSAVLCILDTTRLTVLAASSPDASDINYDNSLSGLTSTKVQGAIDENASSITAIENDLAVIADDVSVNTLVFSDPANKRVFRSGNICSIVAQISILSTATGTGTVVCNFPSDFRPRTLRQIRIYGTYNSNAGWYAAQLKTDGDLVLTTGSGSFTGSITIDLTYMI